MNATLSKLLIKVFIIIVTSFTALYCFQRISNAFLFKKQTNNDSQAIYVWGDSRTYQGLDLDYLRKATARNVYGFSKHGAGVYTFLTFAELVPENSIVLLGINDTILIRNPDTDYSRSNLSFSAISELLREKYPLMTVVNVIEKNLSAFFSLNLEHSPKPDNTKEASNNDDLAVFVKFYSEQKPDYYAIKWKLIGNGIKQLEAKHCKIIIIEFPVSTDISNLMRKSAYANFSRELIEFKTSSVHVYTGIKLISDKSLFYDHSHLNTKGRELMTKYICENILCKVIE